MAYLPVDFDLHDFQLNLNTMQSANFHKRLKELGFESNQQGDVLTYGRGKSRITAFVQGGSELNFLPDFFDDTPGGTVYAILEKLCVAFGGTMIGQYSVPSLGKTWDVRISQGMNLSGRPDVGQRDHVAEEDASTPSSGQQPAQHANPQQKTTQKVKRKPKPSVGDGEVQEGQSGESSRDKVYSILVEERYKRYVDEFGEDTNVFFGFIKEFNEQFPKEEAEQAPQEMIKEEILAALRQYVNVSAGQGIDVLRNELSLVMDEGDPVAMNIADATDFDEQEVEAAINQLMNPSDDLVDDLDDLFGDDEEEWEDEV